MQLRTIGSVLVVSLSIFALACGPEEQFPGTSAAGSSPSSGSTGTYRVSVDETPDGQLTAVLPEGGIIHDRDTYATVVPASIAQALDSGRTVEIQLGPYLSAELAPVLGEDPAQLVTRTISCQAPNRARPPAARHRRSSTTILSG